ncbi:hypothetical protein ScPMuIL_003742 [Solemya velum]
MVPDTYDRLWLSDFFHSFPHINFTFQKTNSTFDPDSRSYFESLLFLGALPIVLLLFILLISSCCICVQCNKKQKKKKKTTCLRIFVGIFLVLAAGSAAVGFYGNEEVNKGVQTFIDSVQDTDKTIEDAVSTLDILNGLVESITVEGVTTLEHVFDTYLSNSSVKYALKQLTDEVEKQSEEVLSDIISVKNDVVKIHLSSITDESTQIEYYRWVGTIVLFCWHFLVFLILLTGVLKKSRCVLILSLVLAFFTTTFIWSGMGLYLGADVGLGDFCMDPDSYVEKVASNEIDRTIVRAYMECSTPDEPKDFTQSIGEAVTAVTKANTTLTSVVSLADKYNISRYIKKPVDLIRADLSYCMSNISSLSSDLHCKHVHENYIKAVDGVCNRALIGASLILLITPLIGVCFLVILCLTPRVIILLKKRRGYIHVDDTDPFLPRPPAYNHYGAIPPPDMTLRSGYPEDCASFLGVTDSSLMGPGTGTPPPAYDPGNFANQYNNLRSSMSSEGSLLSGNHGNTVTKSAS